SLEVDFVLRSSAMRHLRQHFAPVFVRHHVELAKGGEKMQAYVAIITRWMKIPDRPRINYQISKYEVAHGLCGGQQSLRRIARRRNNLERRPIDAVSILHRIVDVALRVHRARQMMVKIAAFGHSFEKIQKLSRIAANRFHALGRTLHW